MTRVDLVSSSGYTLRMNDGTADPDGNVWVVQRLSGWGGARPVLSTMKRMTVDGVVITNVLYGQRDIDISGVVKLASRSTAWDAVRRWEWATDSIVSDGKIIVYGDTGTEHALIRVSAPATATLEGNGAYVAFSGKFIAADPALQAGA